MSFRLEWIAPWLRWTSLRHWAWRWIGSGFWLLGLRVTWSRSIAYGLDLSIAVYVKERKWS